MNILTAVLSSMVGVIATTVAKETVERACRAAGKRWRRSRGRRHQRHMATMCAARGVIPPISATIDLYGRFWRANVSRPTAAPLG